MACPLLSVLAPERIASEAFTDAPAALTRLQEICDRNTRFLARRSRACGRPIHLCASTLSTAERRPWLGAHDQEIGVIGEVRRGAEPDEFAGAACRAQTRRWSRRHWAHTAKRKFAVQTAGPPVSSAPPRRDFAEYAHRRHQARGTKNALVGRATRR
jgi:hypothetical protein